MSRAGPIRTAQAAPSSVRRRRDAAIPLDAATRAWTLAGAGGCLLPLLLQLPPSLALGVALVFAVVGALSWRGVALPTWLRLLLAVALVGGVLVVSRFNFGRDTGCALLAAMLAVKPVELASVRDARSLLGFGLFAPFATFLLDQRPMPLALGLAGALLAMTALLQVSALESRDSSGAAAPAWRSLLGVGRLVAIGLPLALAAFWLFPRLATPLWGVSERALARPGLSDRMSPGEWIDLMTDDTPALRVSFDGPMPPPAQLYWRGPVLVDFDGRTWTQSPWLRNLPAGPVAFSPRQYAYTLDLEPTDRRQVVALDLPMAAPDGLQLSLDRGLFAPRALTVATRWRFRSAAPQAFEPDLKQTLRRIALRLPAGYNPRTLDLARQWRGEAGVGAAADQAVVDRALAWFKAGFSYTLDTPLLGRNSVDEFLFEQKAGFCEHFSSSFVVLMRSAGIPARVVTGYVGGYRNPFGGYWLVRRSDAHAWAEVWLEHRGWVRVDPTAAVAPERILDTLADRDGVDGGLGALGTMFNAGDWMRRGWNDFVLGFDAARQQRMLQPLGLDRFGGSALLAVFVVAAGLALAWMLWLTARAEREHDPVLRAWHRLARRYRKLGLARRPDEPAVPWALRVALARPAGDDALQSLALRVDGWRYARDGGSAQPLARLLRDLRAHRP